MKNRLYTIGSSTRSEAEFIDLLVSRGITLVIDVRSYNTSKRYPHFDESRSGNLSRMLAKHGISYDSSLQRDLGGLQFGKMSVGNFRRYAQTKDFHDALDKLKDIVNQHLEEVVILCAEKDPQKCHRTVIGDALAGEGWEVIHI